MLPRKNEIRLSMPEIEESVRKKMDDFYNIWNYQISTPWDHVPNNCKAIKIFPDGSWISFGEPECRGIWKKCPKELLPGDGKKFIIHYRDGKRLTFI